jgi:hypothetical protein
MERRCARFAGTAWGQQSDEIFRSAKVMPTNVAIMFNIIQQLLHECVAYIVCPAKPGFGCTARPTAAASCAARFNMEKIKKEINAISKDIGKKMRVWQMFHVSCSAEPASANASLAPTAHFDLAPTTLNLTAQHQHIY